MLNERMEQEETKKENSQVGVKLPKLKKIDG